MRSLPFSAALFVSAAALVAPSAAQAHGGGAAQPTQVPPAAPGDGASAETILRELDAVAAKDPDRARVTAEPVASAKRALERAHGARVSGDEIHARMLDGLALEWAETARELDRAAAAEQAAAASGKQAHEAQTKAERARSLLEETQARRGRAAAELARVEAEAKDAAKGAADSEAARIDAAKKKGAKPSPKESAPKESAPKESAPKAPKEHAAATPKKAAK